jgi:hypothetical protein
MALYSVVDVCIKNLGNSNCCPQCTVGRRKGNRNRDMLSVTDIISLKTHHLRISWNIQDTNAIDSSFHISHPFPSLCITIPSPFGILCGPGRAKDFMSRKLK